MLLKEDMIHRQAVISDRELWTAGRQMCDQATSDKVWFGILIYTEPRQETMAAVRLM